MRAASPAGLAGTLAILLAAAACGPDTGSTLPPTRYDTSATGVITLSAVGLRVDCAVDNVEFTLKPWRAKASVGTQVKFHVQGVSEVVIGMKGTAPWPFVEPSPQTVHHNSRLTLTSTVGSAYKYTVGFDCGANGGPVVIDPDIIVTS